MTALADTPVNEGDRLFGDHLLVMGIIWTGSFAASVHGLLVSPPVGLPERALQGDEPDDQLDICTS